MRVVTLLSDDPQRMVRELCAPGVIAWRCLSSASEAFRAETATRSRTDGCLA